MKSPYSLWNNVNRYALLCALAGLLSYKAYANDAKMLDIEAMRHHIAQNLTDANPEAVIIYDHYNNKFEELLLRFVNVIKNNDPLESHINNFDCELNKFDTEIVNNPQFSKVKSYTEHLHKQFRKLVDVFRKQLKKKNFKALLAELERYGHLMPQSVKKHNPITLIAGLKYRCSLD